MDKLEINNNMQAPIVSPLDYDQMREYGLKYIQEYASQNWTDFNLHDPGTTILEALCFSLADLGYRTNFDIKDLLTHSEETHPTLSGTLYPAKDILSSNPITTDEYRKLILENVPEVTNVWFTKKTETHYATESFAAQGGPKSIVPNGFYQVTLQLSTELYELYSNQTNKIRSEESRIRNRVLNLLNSHRNLCEIFKTVKILKPADIGVCMDLEIDEYMMNENDIRKIINDLRRTIKDYVSPQLTIYPTISKLLAKGKTQEEIYQGEVSQSGRCIDMEELKQFDSPTTLYTSDLIALIKKIEGIQDVHIHFIDNCKIPKVIIISDYCLRLKDPDYFLHLVPFYYDKENNTQVVSRNKIYLSQKGLNVRIPLCEKSTEKDDEYKEKNQYTELDVEPSIESKNRKINHYFSFQELLPNCYNLKEDALSHASSEQKGEILQLKAYLSFFDQILSDYLVQLNSLDKIFSIEEEEKKEKEEKEEKIPIDLSWFHGTLSENEIKGFSKIVKLSDGNYENPEYQTYESQKELVRLKIINHLLARVNDNLADYMMLKKLYLSNDKNINFEVRENFEDKKRLLRMYPNLSTNRSLAINTDDKTWGISGLEKKILYKLGINKPNKVLTPSEPTYYNRLDLPDRIIHTFYDNSKEGFEKTFGLHVLEHILFFPNKINKENFLGLTKSDDSSEYINDPYSFHVTIILPGWLSFCQSLKFREYVENVIRSEMPAHVVSKICWVSPCVMHRVETTLKILRKEGIPQDRPLQEYFSINSTTIKNLFDIIYNIYPSSLLEDDDEYNSNPNRLDFVCLDADDIWSYTEYKQQESSTPGPGDPSDPNPVPEPPLPVPPLPEPTLPEPPLPVPPVPPISGPFIPEGKSSWSSWSSYHPSSGSSDMRNSSDHQSGGSFPKEVLKSINVHAGPYGHWHVVDINSNITLRPGESIIEYDSNGVEISRTIMGMDGKMVKIRRDGGVSIVPEIKNEINNNVNSGNNNVNFGNNI